MGAPAADCMGAPPWARCISQEMLRHLGPLSLLSWRSFLSSPLPFYFLLLQHIFKVWCNPRAIPPLSSPLSLRAPLLPPHSPPPFLPLALHRVLASCSPFLLPSWSPYSSPSLIPFASPLAVPCSLLFVGPPASPLILAPSSPFRGPFEISLESSFIEYVPLI